jgi:hypothetical protein
MLLSRETLLLFAGGNTEFLASGSSVSKPMPIQVVTVVSQLVPSAMVVDVQTGHVAPSTMHMDPCRLWQTLLLHPLRNIPPSPTQWDIPQIHPTMALFITP